MGYSQEVQTTKARYAEAQALQPGMVTLRRALHANPELGLDLPETQRKVVEALAGLEVEVTLGRSLSSVTAVLRGGADGPSVLLRADMDALPMVEKTGLDYASQDETMHACGHDMHVAMLVGAARLLEARREELAGSVVFMFQPGEEGFDGASVMIEEGVLAAAEPVAGAYGLHVLSAKVAHGVFASRPGPMMAANDSLEVTVVGRGGHGSEPDKAQDPIVVAAELVISLQTAVTRTFDVFDPVILTVGTFHAGTKNNIIPDEARFEATIRTFSAGSRAKAREVVKQLCTDLPAAYGLRADVRWVEGYQPTVNDPGEFAFLARTAQSLFGDGAFAEMASPVGGAEDFSRVLARVPGCYAFLGACPRGLDPATAPTNHSAYAEFDDSLLWNGALLLTELAARKLASAAQAAASRSA